MALFCFQLFNSQPSRAAAAAADRAAMMLREIIIHVAYWSLRSALRGAFGCSCSAKIFGKIIKNENTHLSALVFLVVSNMPGNQQQAHTGLSGYGMQRGFNNNNKVGVTRAISLFRLRFWIN